ncbi:MAG: leucine-rich repeat protein [Clostridia bacterium]|nr:leucine-rich repeat protein [Clostridia bacterium]
MKKAKRILLLVLTAVMMFGLAVSAADVTPGDVNGNGVKGPDDALYLLRHILLPQNYPVNQPADMDGDGVIGPSDALYLLRHVLLPETYPLKSCLHEEVVLPAKEATCTEDGLTEGKVCALCELVIVPQEVVKATGHQYDGVVCTVCGYESNASQGLSFVLSEDASYYILTGIGDCTDTEVIIPEQYEGLPVKAIAEDAFSLNEKITSVSVPMGVTNIGSLAFAHCPLLSEISLPDSVTEIGAYAFYNCTNLEEIVLPAYMTEIRDGLLQSCVNLKRVQMPKQVILIEDHAFDYCLNLAQITLPETVSHIGKNAFYNCKALVAIRLPESLVSIGDEAFSNCTSLKYVHISNGVTEIPSYLFAHCSSLESITLPESVTAIGDRAFTYCTSLQTVLMGEKVTEIGDHAFAYCELLENIKLSSALTSIGDSAFRFCKKLSSVSLPRGLTALSNHVFADCTALSEIMIPDSVQKVGQYAFMNCTSLEKAEMSDRLLYLSYAVFQNCTGLDQILFRGTENEWQAFAKEENWDLNAGDYEVICMDEDDDVSEGLYYRISDDGTYYILSGIGTYSGAYIVIPDEYEGLPVKAIGAAAFWEQAYIGGVKMNDAITVIEPYAFHACRNLKMIDFSDSLQVIGSHAFKDCTRLEYVGLPDSVETVGEYAFYGCIGLTGADLSKNLTQIEKYTFYHCSSLQDVTIFNGVTSIGIQAFADGGIMNIYFEGMPSQWEAIRKEAEWDRNTSWTLICTQEDLVAYPNDVDRYSGTYAYEYLGNLEKGAALQQIYRGLDDVAKAFHVNNTTQTRSDGYLTAVNYKDLDLTRDEAISVWVAYRMDHPLYYWMDNVVGYTSSSIYIKVDSDYFNGEERRAHNENIYSEVYKLALMLREETSPYQIAMAYHDYILSTVDYAYEADGTTPQDDRFAHSIIGVFERKGAVCEGFSKAFQMLLNYSGVENIYVLGDAGGSHAWNMVKLEDGNWYWCDLTWDDKPSRAWGITYNYFCVNSTQDVKWYSNDGTGYAPPKTFLDDHTPDPANHGTIDFMYALPEISNVVFDGGLRDTFYVDGMEYAISGYRTVQFVYTEKSGAIEIPETVTYNGVTYTVTSIGAIKENGLYTLAPVAMNVTSVSIPKTVRYIWDYSFSSLSLKEISVDAENPYYFVQDGKLCEKTSYVVQKPVNATEMDAFVPWNTMEEIEE